MPTQGNPYRTMALERVASEEPISDHSAEELTLDLNSLGQDIPVDCNLIGLQKELVCMNDVVLSNQSHVSSGDLLQLEACKPYPRVTPQFPSSVSDCDTFNSSSLGRGTTPPPRPTAGIIRCVRPDQRFLCWLPASRFH